MHCSACSLSVLPYLVPIARPRTSPHLCYGSWGFSANPSPGEWASVTGCHITGEVTLSPGLPHTETRVDPGSGPGHTWPESPSCSALSVLCHLLPPSQVPPDSTIPPPPTPLSHQPLSQALHLGNLSCGQPSSVDFFKVRDEECLLLWVELHSPPPPPERDAEVLNLSTCECALIWK